MNFLTGHQVDALRTLREKWGENEIVIVGAAALGPATWGSDVVEASKRLKAFMSGFCSDG